MKNKHLRKLLTALIATTIALTSCVEKIDLNNMDSDITLNPSLVAPIGSVHAYMTDLLSFVDSSFVNVDTNNGIYVFFEQDGVSVNFEMDQFEKGEKLEETLTIGKIEEVGIAFSLIDQYIVDFNNKIRTIKEIINTGVIKRIEPIQEPEGIMLPDEYLTQIVQINKNIEIINKYDGQDINSLPDALQQPIREALEEIEKEIDAIGELKPFTEVTIPKTEFTFVQESSYNFGFSEYVEGEKNIRIDSLLISTANIDFEIEISGVDFTDGSYLLVNLDFPQLFDEEIQNKLETIKITENKFVFKEKFNDIIARLQSINQNDETELAVTFTFVSNGAMTISRNAKIEFSTEINTINFEQLYGHVWQKEEFKSGEIAFDIPEELFRSDLITSNNILISNPQVNINLKHNMGIPMLLKLDNFYYEKDGERFYLDKNEERYNIELEIEKPEEVNGFATKELSLDNTNSPIAELIQKFPEHIGLTWHALTPLTENDDVHFIVNPLVADMDIDVKVPFQFDENTYFTYKDTIAANFEEILQDITNIVNIDTLCLYLDVTSALPATVVAKLYYFDENDELLYESTDFEITAAEVDEEGRVTTPTVQSKTISFNSDLAKEVMGTKKIMFEVGLKSKDELSKIYIQSTDKIDLNLSAFAKANINITSNTEE